MAVPRIYEKIEQKVREAEAQASGIGQKVLAWGKGYGTAAFENRLADRTNSFMYGIAKSVVLNKVKSAIGLEECEMFFYGAAPMKQSTIDYFVSIDMPILNLYGMTETTSAVTHHRLRKVTMHACGFAFPGSSIIIKDKDENGEGEVCMKSRGSMMGYFKNPEASEATFDENGYVMSGDLGKLDKDGFLKITGRKKELIITAGGENIAPVPIEDTFKDSCYPCSNIMVIGDM